MLIPSRASPKCAEQGFDGRLSLSASLTPPQQSSPVLQQTKGSVRRVDDLSPKVNEAEKEKEASRLAMAVCAFFFPFFCATRRACNQHTLQKHNCQGEEASAEPKRPKERWTSVRRARKTRAAATTNTPRNRFDRCVPASGQRDPGDPPLGLQKPARRSIHQAAGTLPFFSIEFSSVSIFGCVSSRLPGSPFSVSRFLANFGRPKKKGRKEQLLVRKGGQLQRSSSSLSLSFPSFIRAAVRPVFANIFSAFWDPSATR